MDHPEPDRRAGERGTKRRTVVEILEAVALEGELGDSGWWDTLLHVEE